MNKIKIFLNPIEGREKYLNHIANEGYRLVKSGSIIHEFEKTNSDHRYAVEYIGYMNNKERKKYTEFLNSMNLKVFTAPLNIGKFSFGNVKLRPYNSPKSMIATSPGMINKEILIIETDGSKKIPIFSDKESKNVDINRRKAPYYYLLFFSILIILLALFKVIDYKTIILAAILFVLSSFGLFKLYSIKEDKIRSLWKDKTSVTCLHSKHEITFCACNVGMNMQYKKY